MAAPAEVRELDVTSAESGSQALGSSTAGQPTDLTTAEPKARERLRRAGVVTRRKRRRPAGEPPPLPRSLRSTGKYWLALAVVVVIAWAVIFTVGSARILGTRVDLAILTRITALRDPTLTRAMRRLDAVGSDLTVSVLRWVIVLGLLLFRRIRHLLVFLGSILVVALVSTLATIAIARPRPFDVSILGHWEGAAHPSRPVATFAVTLMALIYTLVPAGRPRTIAKWVTGAALLVVACARLYLAVDHPTDVIVGVILGVAVPLVAFRLLTPNEAFPVTYRRRGRAAHLDVGGQRGRAIETALEEQLGLDIIEMKPFGLGGSGGSTPLRLCVEGEPNTYLFAKLYAQAHLRADRWYKLGRTLLYGRLEDEGSFSSVRRLVQYEDYMLRVMKDAGLPTPQPFGFVEITPEREYLIVIEFFEGSKELLEADVDDNIIDRGLQLVRSLWDAGLAHRDIKPSNLLVRGQEVFLIDVAFAEVRPTPWRQAVDLANMMLILALRSDPDRVYERALRLFTPDEIGEAFASTRSVTMPSQSRSLLRKDRRDLLDRFRELAPPRRPLSIQRWSLRRVGLTAGVLLTALVGAIVMISSLQGVGLIPVADTPLIQAPECRRVSDGMILMAQSVPTASRIPCLVSLPAGWSFETLFVHNDGARMSFSFDRPGVVRMSVRIKKACPTRHATEIASDEPGTRRFERVDSLFGYYSGTRYYTFPGGCVMYHFRFSRRGDADLANAISLALGFKTRKSIATEVAREGFSLYTPAAGQT